MRVRFQLHSSHDPGPFLDEDFFGPPQDNIGVARRLQHHVATPVILIIFCCVFALSLFRVLPCPLLSLFVIRQTYFIALEASVVEVYAFTFTTASNQP